MRIDQDREYMTELAKQEQKQADWEAEQIEQELFEIERAKATCGQE